ncbi:MAG: leucyl/phenylalanyl-tRNA--protein transferase [Alphaproteobacteria bacterium]|nr:leucyl/phenylalanyl-tRNA--protein transferase [Alphaproteobacteria bacterium]
MARDSAHDIHPDQLLKAYTLGYFPMGRRRDDPKVVWVLPDVRGVLRLENARAPRKLRQLIAREPFEVKADAAFGEVIAACAAPGAGREETWINDPIEQVYRELHRLGYAHSVECYKDGELVGGLYGVAIGGIFCGESMFSRADNASKVALVYLIARLKMGGFRLLDTQFHTEHLAQFGVEKMADADYQRALAEHLSAPADFSKAPDYLSIVSVLQSITQTS